MRTMSATAEPQPSSPPLRVLEGAATEPAFSATVSSTEMVRLTGVGRERLRTWERRHGFPKALRMRNNARHYLVEDVRRVAAVLQLVSGGYPVAEAIESVLSAPEAPAAELMLGDSLDHAPMPALALSDPHALRVRWTNGRTRTGGNAPVVGAEMGEMDAILPPTAMEAIRRLLVSEETGEAVIEHHDWMNPATTVRSTAWRLSPALSPEPTVVLLQIPESHAPGVTAKAAQFHEQSLRWAAASAEAREILRSDSGLTSLQRALRSLVAAGGARDGILALTRGGRLRTATSVNGGIAARDTELLPCADLIAALQDGELDWLCDTTKAALGVPSYLGTVAIPMMVGEHRLGAAIMVFDGEFAVGDATRELMLSIGSNLASALLRGNAPRETGRTAIAAPLQVTA